MLTFGHGLFLCEVQMSKMSNALECTTGLLMIIVHRTYVLSFIHQFIAGLLCVGGGLGTIYLS